jgi:hypothetical protein
MEISRVSARSVRELRVNRGAPTSSPRIHPRALTSSTAQSRVVIAVTPVVESNVLTGASL